MKTEDKIKNYLKQEIEESNYNIIGEPINEAAINILTTIFEISKKANLYNVSQKGREYLENEIHLLYKFPVWGKDKYLSLIVDIAYQLYYIYFHILEYKNMIEDTSAIIKKYPYLGDEISLKIKYAIERYNKSENFNIEELFKTRSNEVEVNKRRNILNKIEKQNLDVEDDFWE